MAETVDEEEFHYIIKIKRFQQSCASRVFKKIHVYDFDNTLFHSPFPNRELWSSRVIGMLVSSGVWYRNRETLSPPVVPEHPGDGWFADDIVAEALRSIKSEDTVSVLMTGRLHHIFAERIGSIIASHSSKELAQFDLQFYKEDDPSRPCLTHANTMSFKLGVLHHLLRVFPSVTEIEMYDDRTAHVSQFQRELQKLVETGRLHKGLVHLVEEGPEDLTPVPPQVEKAMVFRVLERHNAQDRTQAPLKLIEAVQFTGLAFDEQFTREVLAQVTPPRTSKCFAHARYAILRARTDLNFAKFLAPIAIELYAVGRVANKVVGGLLRLCNVSKDVLSLLSNTILCEGMACLPFCIWLAPNSRSSDLEGIKQWQTLETPITGTASLREKVALDIDREDR